VRLVTVWLLRFVLGYVYTRLRLRTVVRSRTPHVYAVVGYGYGCVHIHTPHVVVTLPLRCCYVTRYVYVVTFVVVEGIVTFVVDYGLGLRTRFTLRFTTPHVRGWLPRTRLHFTFPHLCRHTRGWITVHTVPSWHLRYIPHRCCGCGPHTRYGCGYVCYGLFNGCVTVVMRWFVGWLFTHGYVHCGLRLRYYLLLLYDLVG